MDATRPRHYSRRGQSLQERLLTNSVKQPNGCREWTGYINRTGYGMMRWDGKIRLVHRCAYQAFVGQIPDEHGVLHHCDNRRCIEGNHLFTGTNADNNADRVKKGRSGASRGEGHARSKLTNDDIVIIRSSADSHRKMAERFGVHFGCIWSIRKRITWKHIP